MQIMTRRIAWSAIVGILLVLSRIGSAAETIVIEGTLYSYETQSQIKEIARSILLKYDKQIEKKEAAACSRWNPFKGLARKRCTELQEKRSAFLAMQCTIPATQVVCPRCKGSASKNDNNRTYVICKTCNTSGNVDCDKCNGMGDVPGIIYGRNKCKQCDGTGKVRCRYCQGRGYILCRQCNATGRVDQPATKVTISQLLDNN